MSGKHCRVHHKGGHRKPNKTKRILATSGATAAAGVIAVGLAAGPAGASTQQGSTHTLSAAVAHENHLKHYLHELHLLSLAHAKLADSMVTTVTTSAPAGIYSFSQLEALWRQAGGSAGTEVTAACIAEHESGGRSNAESPTWDFGLFQIHGSWGPAMATFNPLGNAIAAVKISNDGTNWSPWTTAPDCGV